MKAVNNKSKIILDKLWEMAYKNKNHFKLNNDETFIPLTIEIIVRNEISLCHYGKLNGDAMRDPEMVFWKNDNGDYFPYYFRNDWVGFEQFSGEIIDYELIITNKERQKEQAEFADIWMLNIEYQQLT
ncbi:MAG: hypothetical protein FWD14_01975 [Treponema sp.]|nr:hypothetical protein [Treponema sp.]